MSGSVAHRAAHHDAAVSVDPRVSIVSMPGAAPGKKPTTFVVRTLPYTGIAHALLV
jgi:hypothetical protein